LRPDRLGERDLRHFVDALLWDRQRASAVTGPISALLEALRDPKAEPERVRALARHVGESFQGGAGRSRYLADGEEVVREQMLEVGRRVAGHASYLYGIEGLDVDLATGDRRILPGPAPCQVTVLTAVSGCLSGDTVIELNRAGKSFRLKLSEVVRRFNGGIAGGKIWAPGIATKVRARSTDGFIRLHLLRSACASGRKVTYRVRVAGGREIRATKDHRFLTSNGWKRLERICVGDKLAVDAGVARTRLKKAKSYYPSLGNMKRHPYAVHVGRRECPACYRVPTHRLVMEAHLNVMDLGEFLVRVRAGRVDGLRFLDAREWTVHHQDEDASNFKLSNLELVERREDARRHGERGAWKHVTGSVGFEQVVAIEMCGEEDTFDLEMEGEPRNFVANGFVVHNSGKTTAAMRMSLGIARQRRRVLYGAFEMGPGVTLELLACLSLGWSRERLMNGHTQDVEAPPRTPMAAREQVALEERCHAIHPWIRMMRNPFRAQRGGEKRSNEHNLAVLHEHVVDSGCEVFVADLWKRCLVDARPEAEEDALYQQQAMAEQTRTHHILLQQQRLKDVEMRPDKRPTREGIKGSAAWVEVADTIIGWHLPAAWKAVADDKIEAFILKQRYGRWPLGVEFDWSGEHGSIAGGTSIEYKHAEEQGTGVFGGEFKAPTLGGGDKRRGRRE
jgi:hypothetical protein